MSETFMNMTVTAVVTAILSLVLPFAMWRAIPQTGTNQALAKPVTLRISNIPRNMTKGKFGDILTDLADEMSTLPSAADRPQLLGWSFARSGHTERMFVAIATFRVPPVPSQLESAIKCAIKVDSARLRVDLDFFGLTPLADPQNPAVE
jgi:hypothetical protein